MRHREFIAPAADDDDSIVVEEDPPDYAAGERDVPLDGVPTTRPAST